MSDNEGKSADQNLDEVAGAPSAGAPTAAPPPADASEAEAAGAEVAGLKADLDKAKAEASKNRDQLLRTAADFDNFRKRARRDVEDAQRKGLEKALLELLPVSDNLERAVQAAQGTSDVQSIVEGVRMVLRFYEDALSRLGVERVASVGQGFDPGLHEAVQQVESDQAPGTIVSEMVPGYRLGGKLLRPAVVAVARPRAATPSDGQSDSAGDAEGAREAPQN